MLITYTVQSLDTEDAWANLARALGDGHPEVVGNTIRHLRILGAKSYVLEDPYIDRDYTADYLHFYAGTFRTYARHCKRAHFFSGDVSSLLRDPRSTPVKLGLAQISSIIHRDPHLNAEGIAALEEMIKATYARLRTDRNESAK